VSALIQWAAFVASCVWLYRGEVAVCAVWLCVAETFARHRRDALFARAIAKLTKEAGKV
jgi:hypothetical protein